MVKKMSRTKFQKMFQSKINENAAKDLLKTQSKQSKSKHLKISIKFETASYLQPNNLCMKEISTLFKFRSRTIDVKTNSESAHRDNLWCTLCHLFPETQEHLFQCSEIRKKQDLVNYRELSYNMIYGSLENREKLAKSFHPMLMTRMDLIREQKTSTPSQLEDPCTS